MGFYISNRYYLLKVYTGANLIPCFCTAPSLLLLGATSDSFLTQQSPELYTDFLRLFLSSPHSSSSRTPYFIWSPLLLNTDSWKKTHDQHFCLKQSCYFCSLQQDIFNMCFLRASWAAPETCVLRMCGGLE